ncbi:MAG TPA: hypothetical protein VNH13_03660, partial [Candidatus Acidoferrales bacterium]|nr:hypothetical protein [Candidatus Acidoferrales bacterium]
AADWQLPASVRGAMRSWQFSTATAELDAVEAILRQRAALEREAAGASLRLPVTLRHAFETGDLVGAATEASAELATIGTIEDATRRRLAEPTLLESLGLLGADPEAGMRAAREALAGGDLSTANRAASAARAAWASAAGVGQARVVSGVLLLASCILGAGLALSLSRRLRRPPAAG